MTTITALFIPADTEAPTELRDIDADATLAALQSAVGRLIEPVHLDRQRADMYVNEEGKLLSLPVNVRATFLAGALGGILGWDQIAGDAIIAGGVDEEGDTTGLDPLQVHELHAALQQV
ncbi:DUF3846 domain-containing protein [Kocuria rhizophila]|uniref:DUF3846 domain-containing protein n=1 Tax=Kocuria rhizophila TaxID=72000 RepID=UPI00073D34AA|nr:DUF3846 domain-containing protein [Kocuria rhizophila]